VVRQLSIAIQICFGVRSWEGSVKPRLF